MKNVLKISLAAFVFIGLSSCANPDKRRAKGELEVISVQPIGDGDLRDDIKSIKYVQLETTDESVFGEVTHMLVHEDKIIIKDNLSKIYLFDKQTGRFIHLIGSMGGGAEEYANAGSIALNPSKNGITLWDRKLGKLISYDWDNNLLFSMNLEVLNEACPEDVYLLDENTAIFSTSIAGKGAYSDPLYDPYIYLVVDIKDDRVLDTFLSRKPFTGMKSTFTPYLKKPGNINGNQFMTIKVANDTLFNWTQEDGFKPSCKIGLPDSYRFASLDLINEQSGFPELGSILVRESGYFSGFNTHFQTDNYIYLSCCAFKDGAVLLNKNNLTGKILPWGWGNDESVDANCERIFRGKGMFKIYAASDNEFIGVFNDYSATEAMIKDKKDIQIPEELKEILEKSTEDSNPCIVIYEV